MLHKVPLFLSLSRVSKVCSFDLASLLIHAVISSFNIQVKLPGCQYLLVAGYFTFICVFNVYIDIA